MLKGKEQSNMKNMSPSCKSLPLSSREVIKPRISVWAGVDPWRASENHIRFIISLWTTLWLLISQMCKAIPQIPKLRQVWSSVNDNSAFRVQLPSVMINTKEMFLRIGLKIL